MSSNQDFRLVHNSTKISNKKIELLKKIAKTFIDPNEIDSKTGFTFRDLYYPVNLRKRKRKNEKFN